MGNNTIRRVSLRRPALILVAFAAALSFGVAPAYSAPTDLDSAFSGDGKQTLDLGRQLGRQARKKW